MHSANKAAVMVIEDNTYDFEILQWAFTKSGNQTPLQHFRNGTQALDFLHSISSQPEQFAQPAVILLDLTLQDMDGLEILYEIKSDERLKHIPVIIWTSSGNDDRITDCFQQGANSYMIKPTKRENFLQNAQFLQAYCNQTQNKASTPQS
ncbi:response regulator [Dictyobacter sp. S3.2.2.5]|uniref:Response regulator n=1 Tax=Dictyobacter halimunensis TaxID=3026934 RepID=A0ABQ6FLA4_9CHLR|nr:response regulator [Dictyobacter sp. S3.2.2.5]